MKTKRITVIFYALAFGIAIGYWAGQENAQISSTIKTAECKNDPNRCNKEIANVETVKVGR